MTGFSGVTVPNIAFPPEVRTRSTNPSSTPRAPPRRYCDPGRQREYDVEIRHRQQLGLALGEPLPCCCALAFWAVPVAAGIVGNGGVAAVLAARDMAAEGAVSIAMRVKPAELRLYS